jgi:hypothetical protein
MALDKTWRQILAWLDLSEYQSAENPDFERFDPGGGIEVWVGVAPKSCPPEDGA